MVAEMDRKMFWSLVSVWSVAVTLMVLGHWFIGAALLMLTGPVIARMEE